MLSSPINRTIHPAHQVLYSEPNYDTLRSEDIFSDLSDTEQEELCGHIAELFTKLETHFTQSEINSYIVILLKGITHPDEKLSIAEELNKNTSAHSKAIYNAVQNLIVETTPAKERFTIVKVLKDLLEEEIPLEERCPITAMYDYLEGKLHSSHIEKYTLLELVSDIDCLSQNSAMEWAKNPHALFVKGSLFDTLCKLKNAYSEEIAVTLFSLLAMLGKHLNSTSLTLVNNLLQMSEEKNQILDALHLLLQLSYQEITDEIVNQVLSFCAFADIQKPQGNIKDALNLESALSFYSALPTEKEKKQFEKALLITSQFLHVASQNILHYQKKTAFILNKMIAHSATPYQIQGNPDTLGRGTFGVVRKVRHVAENKFYAIKTASSKQGVSNEESASSLRREYTLLDTMEKDSQGLCSFIIRKFRWIGNEGDPKPSLVLELHGKNLSEILITEPSILSFSFVQKIAAQMLQALRFLQKHEIVHADIKPANILMHIAHKDRVVLSDFGSGFFVPWQKGDLLYKQTRWHRSPECTLETGNYSYPIDMWSLGVTLVDLLTHSNIFQAKNRAELAEWHQIRLGTYPASLIHKTTCRKALLEYNSQIFCIKQIPNESVSAKITNYFLKQKEQSAEEEAARKKFISLTKEMLSLEPENRITAENALEHEFVSGML
jgi:hypothetical protein